MIDYCEIYYTNGKVETHEHIDKIKKKDGELVLKTYMGKKIHIPLYTVRKYETDLKIHDDTKKKKGLFRF